MSQTKLANWKVIAGLTDDAHRFKKLKPADLSAYFRQYPNEVFFAPLLPPAASITPDSVSLV
jgi:hypothetical protein